MGLRRRGIWFFFFLVVEDLLLFHLATLLDGDVLDVVVIVVLTRVVAEGRAKTLSNGTGWRFYSGGELGLRV